MTHRMTAQELEDNPLSPSDRMDPGSGDRPLGGVFPNTEPSDARRRRDARLGGLESARIASGPPGVAVFGRRVETLLGALGLGGSTGADVTEIGDVAAGRVGFSFGAADLRIKRPGSGTAPGDLPGGPTRAPTADPNRPILKIPRPTEATPNTSTAPRLRLRSTLLGMTAVRI